MAAAIIGLAALLYASSIAFQTLKYLGVAYLLFMAWHTLREHGALTLERKDDARTPAQVIVSAILVNFLNPRDGRARLQRKGLRLQASPSSGGRI
jgi:threonine/homoserine/homoserine lactone efflux protein